jgi:cytoskeletal protein RodZ
MTNNSRTNQHPLRKRLVAVLLIVAVLAVGFLAGWLYNRHTTKTSTGTNQTSSSSAPAADNNQSQASKTSQSGTSSTLSTSESKGSTTTSAPTGSYSVQIVSSSVNNGNLHIGTQVGGITTGDCTLTATKSGQSTLQLGSSAVQQDVNSYDCGVFNVATSKFPGGGSWTITLTVTNDGSTKATSTTVSV